MVNILATPRQEFRQESARAEGLQEFDLHPVRVSGGPLGVLNRNGDVIEPLSGGIPAFTSGAIGLGATQACE